MRRQIVAITLLAGVLIAAGCLSKDSATKPPLVVHTIEGYNVSFLFDESGYNVSAKETGYGGGFGPDYYENGINISAAGKAKGLNVSIRKYMAPQSDGLDTLEAFMRMGLSLAGVQAQLNRTNIDGREGLISYVPSQMVLGTTYPAVRAVDYFVDNKTMVSFSAVGISEAEFRALIDSLHVERE